MQELDLISIGATLTAIAVVLGAFHYGRMLQKEISGVRTETMGSHNELRVIVERNGTKMAIINANNEALRDEITDLVMTLHHNNLISPKELASIIVKSSKVNTTIARLEGGNPISKEDQLKLDDILYRVRARNALTHFEIEELDRLTQLIERDYPTDVGAKLLRFISALLVENKYPEYSVTENMLDILGEIVADSIRQSHTPIPIFESISSIPKLLDNKDILQALKYSIDSAENPSPIIAALLKSKPKKKKSRIDDFFVALLQSDSKLLDKLLGKIEDEKDFEVVIKRLAQLPEIRENPVYIRWVLRFLSRSANPGILLKGVKHIEEIIHSREAEYAVLTSIRASRQPWVVIQDIRDIPEIMSNLEVREAIRERVSDISEEIEKAKNPWRIIRAITGVSEIVDDPRIEDAVLVAIRGNL